MRPKGFLQGPARAFRPAGLCVLAGLFWLAGASEPGRLAHAQNGPRASVNPSGASDSAPRWQSAAAQRGQALYAERCAACHAVDSNDAGPKHRGVLGRRAGTVPDFEYSPAMRRSQLVWTRSQLDAWLRDPEALVPGQAMDVSVPDARARHDLIAYLATLR